MHVRVLVRKARQLSQGGCWVGACANNANLRIRETHNVQISLGDSGPNSVQREN